MNPWLQLRTKELILRKTPRTTRLEHTEQVGVVSRIRNFHPGVIVFAVPNGGYRRPAEAARLKDEGVLAGVPDLMIPEPRSIFHGLFLEMKRTTGGRCSEDQVKLIRALRRRGYLVEVCDQGAADAFERVEEYLRLPIPEGFDALPGLTRDELLEGC